MSQFVFLQGEWPAVFDTAAADVEAALSASTPTANALIRDFGKLKLRARRG